MLFQKNKKKQDSILYFFFSNNNILGCLIDPRGNVVFTASSGRLKYKGSNKGTHSAAQDLAFFVSKKALRLGFFSLRLKIKGMGKARKSIVKDLLKGGVLITKISDNTPIIFNGCKPFKR